MSIANAMNVGVCITNMMQRHIYSDCLQENNVMIIGFNNFYILIIK